MTLRPYQVQAIEQMRARYRDGRRSILLVMPTGGGKTITAVSLVASALDRGSRVLWVVHRRELIKQAAAALERAGVTPGIVAPWAPRTDSIVQVASIQTLLARGTRPPASVLVWDEAHHAVAPTYHELAKSYSDSLRLGLTATPERADGVALGNLWDSMVVACTPADLVRSGHLVPAKVLGPTTRTAELAEDPVKAYLTLATRRKAVVFGASVRGARALAHRFTAFGIPAECIDGKLDEDKRELYLDRFARGTVRVLTNVHVLTEGWDCPSADCAVLARGFSSTGSYLQAVGRILRPSPGKTDALVLDLMGAANDHGLPDEAREYSLEGKAIRTGDKTDPITQCKQCGAVFRAAEFRDATCPACGAVRKGRQDPAVKRAILVALAARDQESARVSFLSARYDIARKRGYKVGWAFVQFRQKYGRWPTWSEKEAAMKRRVA